MGRGGKGEERRKGKKEKGRKGEPFHFFVQVYAPAYKALLELRTYNRHGGT